MTTPEGMPNGESLPQQPPELAVDVDRYWRVQANLQRFMEVADIRIEGSEVLSSLNEAASEQGAIVAPTHSSWLDIIALGVANTERPLRFMGKQELWKLPYIGKLARDVGAYSVDRTDEDSRRSALETSVSLIEQGEWVVMYPEGTRNKSHDRRSLGKLKTGVARVALQASGNTFVVPVGLGYRRGMVRRRAGLFHAGVVIGEPLEIEQADSTEDRVRDLTDHLDITLSKLKNQAVDLAES